jgi:hypothetical protein
LRIKYPETLLATANRLLEETSVPYFELRVDAVDLAKADGDYAVVDLWPGSSYVLDDDTASPLDGAAVTALSVTYDLSNPLAVNVILATRPKRLSDIVERILSQSVPIEDEISVIEAWEKSDLYDRHFGAMLARKLTDAEGGDTDLARLIRDALDDFMSRYVPPFETEIGPNTATLPDALEDHEDRIQAIEDGGGGASPGDEILPVTSQETLSGESEAFAREDHQHQGVPIALTGDPPETGECLLFSGGKLYMAVSGDWLLISHLEAEEES